MRGRRRGAGHYHFIESIDRGHVAARGYYCARQDLRRVLVGRAKRRAATWADFHGQRARLRRRQRLARPV